MEIMRTIDTNGNDESISICPSSMLMANSILYLKKNSELWKRDESKKNLHEEEKNRDQIGLYFL